MAAGGQAVGYGPGVKMSIADFRKTQLTQVNSTEAALELSNGSSTATPNPRKRFSRDEKRARIDMAEEGSRLVG